MWLLDKIIIPAAFVLALLGSMWVPDAHAQSYQTPYSSWYLDVASQRDYVYGFPSASAACAGAMSWRNANAAGRYHRYYVENASANSAQCYLVFYNTANNPASGETYHLVVVRRWGGGGCPPGYTYNPSTGVCSPPACPAAGTDGGVINFIRGWKTGPAAGAPYAGSLASVPESSCISGCRVNIGAVATVDDTTPSANGYYAVRAGATLVHTGEQCESGPEIEDAAPPAGPPPEKNRCPDGTMATGVDESGTTICTGVSEQPREPPPVTENTTVEQNPDGSTTETTVKQVTNADGSVTTTTTTTTTNADGSKSTSISSSTSGTPDGKPGQSDETSDFCKKNPHLNICKNSEITGKCREDISCKGDAIQCAIARQVAEANCRAEKAEEEGKASAAYKLGEAILSGNDPDRDKLPTKENGITYDIPEDLSTVTWLGGGSCFADRTFTLWGYTGVVPFSQHCNILLVLRLVLMTVAGLVSLRIVNSAFVRV